MPEDSIAAALIMAGVIGALTAFIPGRAKGIQGSEQLER